MKLQVVTDLNGFVNPTFMNRQEPMGLFPRFSEEENSGGANLNVATNLLDLCELFSFFLIGW